MSEDYVNSNASRNKVQYELTMPRCVGNPTFFTKTWLSSRQGLRCGWACSSLINSLFDWIKPLFFFDATSGNLFSPSVDEARKSQRTRLGLHDCPTFRWATLIRQDRLRILVNRLPAVRPFGAHKIWRCPKNPSGAPESSILDWGVPLKLSIWAIWVGKPTIF